MYLIFNRVQTIFLNGKAVDDPTHEIVTDKAVIALSAAMSGLTHETEDLFFMNEPEGYVFLHVDSI